MWKSTDGEGVPCGAIVGGSDNGSPLYVARSEIDDEVIVGKFQPQHGCAYMPYGGEEHRKDQFEVLCCIAKHF